MLYVLGILGSIFVILLCISFHEFGHLVAAKLFHVGVVEYSIGMGPSFYSKRKGDTVWSIRAIPFGGYCAMYGEESAEASAKGTSVETIEQNKEKRFRFVKSADYKTDWTDDQKLLEKPFWQKMIIYAAGPIFNVILGALACLISITFFANLDVIQIESLEPNSPAVVAQLQPGDIITGINDRETLVWMDYAEYKATHTLETKDGFNLHILRDDEPMTVWVVEDPETGLVGMNLTEKPVDKTFSSVMLYSWDSFRYMFYSVADTFHLLATGQVGLNDMSGVVGITAVITSAVGEMSGFAATMSLLLYMLSLISINLGVVNMLPLPALDGGRFLLCIFEGLFRRKVPARVEYAINAAGMVLLMILLVYVTYNDIVKLFTGAFSL